MVISSVTGAQYIVPVEVSVSVMDPAAISAAVGWYPTASEVLFGVKIPEPPPQIAPGAFPTKPFKEMAGLFEQIC